MPYKLQPGRQPNAPPYKAVRSSGNKAALKQKKLHRIKLLERCIDDALASACFKSDERQDGAIISPHLFVEELSDEVISALLDEYVPTSFDDRGMSQELGAIFRHASDLAPNQLRVKEIIETVEVFLQIVAFIGAQPKTKKQNTSPIVDVACGHGLLAVLLAYRYPHRKVIACDTKQREVYDALRAGFVKFGTTTSKVKGTVVPLGNLEFAEGMFQDCIRSESFMDNSEGLPLLCGVHACNTLSRDIIEFAVERNFSWAVIPCCIKAGTYISCQLNGHQQPSISNLGESQDNYLVQCGAIAGMFRAEMMYAIDARITIRNVIICGGGGINAKRIEYTPEFCETAH